MVTCIYYILLITGCLVMGLRDVKVTVPMAARKGDSVVLHCHYDLEGDQLYAVKWYKGRAEFYRYTPKENPPMKIFSIPGLSELHVNKDQSNQTQLFLRAVTPTLSGQYNCEVSADAPSFHTAIDAATMDVVEVPLHPPLLSGIKARYLVRDIMIANCTAAPSRPAVNLTWGINGENVNPRLVKQYRQVPQRFPDLQQSMSILEVPLRAQHFSSGGRLTVRCTASLYDLYWQTTEKTAEGEDHQSTVRGNQVPGSEGDKDTWDEYDDDYDDSQGNVIIGVFPTVTDRGEAHSSSQPRPYLELPRVIVTASFHLLASSWLYSVVQHF